MALADAIVSSLPLTADRSVSTRPLANFGYVTDPSAGVSMARWLMCMTSTLPVPDGGAVEKVSVVPLTA